MRRRLVLVSLAVLALSTGATLAADVGLEIGAGPSISLVSDWGITARWVVTTSIGLSLEAGGVQTGSDTVQSPSLTLGVAAKYCFAPTDSSFVPYVGLGTDLRISRGSLVLEVEPFIGLKIRPVPFLSVFGEIGILVPVSDLDAWRWDPRIGLALRLGF